MVKIWKHFSWMTVITGVIFLFVGCSASAPAERALAAAKSSLNSASQTDAPAVAGTIYQQAQRKLTEAENALNSGDEARSRRLAEEASVDAQLAMAQADYENARRAKIDLERAMQ